MKITVRTENLRKVRAQNLVPGVMYGRSIDSIAVQVDTKSIQEALKAYGKNMTFQVELDGEVHNVYIKNVQSNILKPSEIIHFDLHCLSASETVSASIPIEILGKEAFYQSRAYPQQGLTSLEAEYAVGFGMSSMEIDISNMQVGDAIYVKDLKVSEGVTLKDDPDQLIIMIKESSEAEEETTDSIDEDTEDDSETDETKEQA
jgi:large subunit ribosomal protein L25